MYFDLHLALDGMTKIQDFAESTENPDISIVEMLSKYREMCLSTYDDLNKLQSLTKEEASTDYYLISDESSSDEISDEVVEHISSGYSLFKSKMEIFDKGLGGFESSSVHLIAGPSNHGKSVLLTNLLYSITTSNLDEFDSNDAILFITLEDNIIRVLRKLICIYGNYDFTVLRDLFKTSYEIIKNNEKRGIDSTDFKNSIKSLFQDLLNTSIISSTKNGVKIIVKHAPDSTYSPGDIGRHIEKLKLSGIKIKAVIIDYLDVMSPTLTKSYFKTYDNLGQITQELRNLSNIYNLPVITATQNQREAENINVGMSNRTMGDSVLKTRYSDFITNIRMREDLNPFSDEVKRFVLKDSLGEEVDETPEIIGAKHSLITDLIPLELKITKAKELGKGTYKYMLFSKRNVKLYDYIGQYLQDVQLINSNTKQLLSKIKEMTLISNTSQINFENVEDDFERIEAEVLSKSN